MSNKPTSRPSRDVLAIEAGPGECLVMLGCTWFDRCPWPTGGKRHLVEIVRAGESLYDLLWSDGLLLTVKSESAILAANPVLHYQPETILPDRISWTDYTGQEVVFTLEEAIEYLTGSPTAEISPEKIDTTVPWSNDLTVNITSNMGSPGSSGVILEPLERLPEPEPETETTLSEFETRERNRFLQTEEIGRKLSRILEAIRALRPESPDVEAQNLGRT